MQTMTPAEYRAIKDHLGLQHAELAAMIAVDPNTSARYASGNRSVPPTAARLLRLVVAAGLSPADVEAILSTYRVPAPSRGNGDVAGTPTRLNRRVRRGAGASASASSR